MNETIMVFLLMRRIGRRAAENAAWESATKHRPGKLSGAARWVVDVAAEIQHDTPRGSSMKIRIVGLVMLALTSFGKRLHAQSANNAEILRAVFDTLQLGSRNAIVVSSAKGCRPEFDRFRADVECREGQLTASGRSKALNRHRVVRLALLQHFSGLRRPRD